MICILKVPHLKCVFKRRIVLARTAPYETPKNSSGSTFSSRLRSRTASDDEVPSC